jgi:hypothetical protein
LSPHTCPQASGPQLIPPRKGTVFVPARSRHSTPRTSLWTRPWARTRNIVDLVTVGIIKKTASRRSAMTMRVAKSIIRYVSDQAVAVSIRMRDEAVYKKAKAFLNELLGFPHGSPEIESTLSRDAADAYCLDSTQLKSLPELLERHVIIPRSASHSDLCGSFTTSARLARSGCDWRVTVTRRMRRSRGVSSSHAQILKATDRIRLLRWQA